MSDDNALERMRNVLTFNLLADGWTVQWVENLVGGDYAYEPNAARLRAKRGECIPAKKLIRIRKHMCPGGSRTRPPTPSSAEAAATPAAEAIEMTRDTALCPLHHDSIRPDGAA